MKTALPLYPINHDAVLIHPSLPGFPLEPDNRQLRGMLYPFVVATVLPPVNWSELCGFFGVRAPRANHIWPMRALLHIYLLTQLHDKVLRNPNDPAHALLRDDLAFVYEFHMERVAHPMDYWSHIDEMLLMVLRAVKEDQVSSVVTWVVEHCPFEHWDALSFEIGAAHRRIQNHIKAPTAKHLIINLSKRRANVIEHTLRAALDKQGVLTTPPPAPISYAAGVVRAQTMNMETLFSADMHILTGIPQVSYDSIKLKPATLDPIPLRPPVLPPLATATLSEHPSWARSTTNPFIAPQSLSDSLLVGGEAP